MFELVGGGMKSVGDATDATDAGGADFLLLFRDAATLCFTSEAISIFVFPIGRGSVEVEREMRRLPRSGERITAFYKRSRPYDSSGISRDWNERTRGGGRQSI
jgi:hypothetical protein